LKTTLVYWLYPLTALIELNVVVPIRRKLLISLPYLLNLVLAGIDLFGTGMIYYFGKDHAYHGGPLALLPIITLCVYILLLGIHSAIYLAGGDRSKGVFALFITATAVLTAIGEEMGFARGFSESATALELLVYYFFLSSIHFSETQTKLYESHIDLERQRNKLLVAQMQPHFIFNALAAIQSLCYTDSEAAAEYIQIFGEYLRSNIDSISSDDFITFESELAHIGQYVMLEKASTEININVIYELNVKDFMIPPLTIQPIVENAIKYGALSRRDGTGTVKIFTEEKDGMVCITVSDNGSGTSMTKKQKEHRSVGIENVKQRLALKCKGTLVMNRTETGMISTISIPTQFAYVGEG
ncbi:MAG: histidine kinase, partial [Oscillospiraceae bacterium]|nr:histidine kinase [Oscillospiraceae bacterium]